MFGFGCSSMFLWSDLLEIELSFSFLLPFPQLLEVGRVDACMHACSLQVAPAQTANFKNQGEDNREKNPAQFTLKTNNKTMEEILNFQNLKLNQLTSRSCHCLHPSSQPKHQCLLLLLPSFSCCLSFFLSFFDLTRQQRGGEEC